MILTVVESFKSKKVFKMRFMFNWNEKKIPRKIFFYRKEEEKKLRIFKEIRTHVILSGKLIFVTKKYDDKQKNKNYYETNLNYMQL